MTPIRFAPIDDHLRKIQALSQPSIVAVISGSSLFLQVARGLLAPAMGGRHQLREILLTEEGPYAAKSAEIVFCDSVAHQRVRFSKTILYRLVGERSIADVSIAMESYR